LAKACLSAEQAEEMYRYLGIANWEDRVVIPTSHEEMRHEDPYGFQGYSGSPAAISVPMAKKAAKDLACSRHHAKRSITVEHLPRHKKD
jgi:nitrate reductase beta subunit